MQVKRWMMVAILAFLLIVGYVYLYLNGFSGAHPKSPTQQGQMKVACVGDSITYGLGVSSWPENNYPTVLGTLLGKGYHVVNFGESGRTVQETGDRPYAKEKSYANSLTYEPDILVFMMGTNDSKSYNWNGKENFLQAYETILNSYMQAEYPPKLYLCTPATAFYTNGKTDGKAEFNIQPEIVEEIAQIIREFTEVYELETALIDINLMTKEHAEWFEKDGIHPNNEGARAIAEYVATVIKSEESN